MKSLLTALLFVPIVALADFVPGTAQDTMYVIQNAEGKRIITNVKPFPKGYVVIKEYPITIKNKTTINERMPVDPSK